MHEEQGSSSGKKVAPLLADTLAPAIAHALATLDRRIADEVRLTTGGWPAVAPSDPAAHARELIATYRADAASFDDQHASLLLAEVARLHEDVLDDTRAATRAILEALRRDPNSSSVQRTTLRLLLDAGKHTIIAQLVDDLASEIKSSPGRNAMLLDHAVSSELGAGHEERAAQVYQRVLDDDPDSAEAAEGLLRIALRRRDWPKVARVARHLASHTDDKETRRTLLIAAAMLDADRPERERAEWLAQAAALGDRPGIALPMAIGLFLAADDIEGAVRIQLDQGDKRPETAAQLYFQVSWLLARQEQRQEEAITHGRAACQHEPDSLLYVSWLAELYERDGRWNELAEVLGQKARLSTTREEAVETLVALAEVQATQLGRTDQAITALERALTISPTDLACLQSLGRLYARTRRFAELADMHLKEAAVAQDDERRAHALYRAAQILGERLDRADEAVAHLERALELEPRLSSAHRLLEDLYRKTEAYEKLVALHRRQLDQTSASVQQVVLLERIATLLDTHLDDDAGAIEAYEQLLERQASNASALAALSRLYQAAGQHSKLLSSLRAQAMTTEDTGERAALLLRMGQILEEDLNQPEQALAHYREALDCRASAETYEQLGRLLYNTQRWPELVQITEHQLEHAVEIDQKVSLYFRLGRIQEQHLEDRAAAAAAYKEALQLDGAYWPALRGIVRAAHHMPELRRAALEGMLLPSRLEGQDKSSGQLRIALAVIDQQPDVARTLLQRVVEEDEGNGIARDLLLQLLSAERRLADLLPLADELESIPLAIGLKNLELAREHGDKLGESEGTLVALRWRELLGPASGDAGETAALLRERASREPNPAQSTALLLRLARVIEEDPAAASAVCRQILETAPEERRALDLLEHLSRLAESNELLAEALRLREQQSGSDAERATVLTTRGHLHARAGDPTEAEQAWRAALEQDPLCRPAYEALKTRYRAADDQEGLRWTLEHGLQSVKHLDSRNRDLLQRADLRREAGEHEAALADLDLILEQDPGQANALERVERTLREADLYEALVNRLTAARDVATTPLRRAAIDVKMARIYADRLDDPRRAAALLGDAVDKDPDNVAALLLSAEVHGRLEQPTEAIALLSRAVLRSEDEQELIGAHLATAQVFHHVLGVGDRALRSLRTVLKLDPQNVGALQLLAEVSERSGNDTDAEEYLGRLARLVDDPLERARVLGRFAAVRQRTQGDQDERALAAIEEAVALSPADPFLLRSAATLLLAQGKPAQVAELLGKALEILPEEERLGFLLQRGRILAEELGRPDEARTLLRQALEQDPEGEEAVELLVRLLDDKTLEDPAARSEAISLHRRLLARNPLTIESIRQLGRLCERDDRLDEAFSAQAALVFLDKASEEEIYFHKQRRRSLPTRASGVLSAEQRDALVMPDGTHPVRDLLALLKPHLAELTPPDLSHYGLTDLASGLLPEDHGAWSIARECAELLVVKDFRLVEALGGTPEGATEPSGEPTLILPREFARYPVPQQRFLLGRMLACVATDTECCDPRRPEPLSPRTLEMLMAALLRTATPDFGADVASALILDDMAKRLKKRLDKKELERGREAAARAWDERTGLDTWLQSCERGAHRAGLLCAGNLDAISALSERQSTPLPAQLTRDIIGFDTSEQYATLRQQLGLALRDA